MSTPDQLLCSDLSTAACRLAADRGSITEAVDQLRAMARGRRDLVTQAAGLLLGVASVRGVQVGDHPIGAGLLMMAGLDIDDPDSFQRWIDEGRHRASILRNAPDITMKRAAPPSE